MERTSSQGRSGENPPLHRVRTRRWVPSGNGLPRVSTGARVTRRPTTTTTTSTGIATPRGGATNVPPAESRRPVSSVNVRRVSSSFLLVSCVVSVSGFRGPPLLSQKFVSSFYTQGVRHLISRVPLRPCFSHPTDVEFGVFGRVCTLSLPK